MDLAVTSASRADCTVAQVVGEIDACSAPHLHERLVAVIDAGGHHLVVDLSGVGFMDSTGLGVLLAVLTRVREHDGSLRVVCDRRPILKTFAITGLDSMLGVHPTLGDALGQPV